MVKDRKIRMHFRELLTHFLTIILVLVVNSPIIYMIIVSLKPLTQITAIPPIWIFAPTFKNYFTVIAHGGTAMVEFTFAKYALNSIIVSLGSVALTLAVSFPVAYSIARWRTGGEFFRNYILSLYLMPPAVFIPSIFVLFRTWNLVDTHLGLLLVYSVFNLPFSILVLESFIRDLPVEIEEAARIDGCSDFGAMVRMTLPLSRPGLVATSILLFIASWNEYLLGLVLTRYTATTLTVGIAKFVTGYSIFWGSIFAATTLSIIPLTIFFFYIQKYLVRGLTLGTVKG